MLSTRRASTSWVRSARTRGGPAGGGAARIAGGGRVRKGPHRGGALALAVALVVLLGAGMILGRNDDSRVPMVSRTTTTDGTRSSTTVPSSTTAPAPSTTAPSSAGSSEEATGLGSGARRGGSPGGRSDRGGAMPTPLPPGQGGPGSPPGPPGGRGGATRLPIPPAPTPPPGRISAVASAFSAQFCCGMEPPPDLYEVELVYAGGVLYFRRLDDVGSNPGPPDRYGHADTWAPGDISGAQCLATGGGVYQFPDAGPDAYMWGLAGPDIASITITFQGGQTMPTGPALPIPDGSGLRAWIIGDLPPGPVERIDGADKFANVLTTITDLDTYSGASGCSPR